MKDRYRSKTHPELLAGEVFITNIGQDDPLEMRLSRSFGDNRTDWESIGWVTKRRGHVAYDINGMPIHGMSPVFVQRKELEAAGVNPDSL